MHNPMNSFLLDISSQQSTLGFVVTAFLISFLGSWHCLVMCGPIAIHMNNNSSASSWAYHGGRLFSYTFLGAIFGALGEKLLVPENKFIFTFVLLTLLFFIFTSGLAKMGTLPKALSWYYRLEQNIKHILFQKLKISPKSSALTVGLLTGFLPCGWLYTFFSAAILTKSAFAGALLLFIFNLGSLPALLGVSQFFKKGLQKASLNQQKISGILIMLAALYSVGLHLYHSQIWQ